MIHSGKKHQLSFHHSRPKPGRVKSMSLLIASRSAENALLHASIWTLDGILCTVMRHGQHAGAPKYVSAPLYVYHERLACSDGWLCVGRFVLLRVEARLSCGSEADPQGFARAVGGRWLVAVMYAIVKLEGRATNSTGEQEHLWLREQFGVRGRASKPSCQTMSSSSSSSASTSSTFRLCLFGSLWGEDVNALTAEI